MTTIADLSAAELTEAYRRGALSPVEVARDVLARIEANAAFNAFLPIDPDAGAGRRRGVGSALARESAARARSTACRQRSRTISGSRASRRGAARAPAM